jgi:hypothetical protein
MDDDDTNLHPAADPNSPFTRKTDDRDSMGFARPLGRGFTVEVGKLHKGRIALGGTAVVLYDAYGPYCPCRLVVS